MAGGHGSAVLLPSLYSACSSSLQGRAGGGQGLRNEEMDGRRAMTAHCCYFAC